MKHSLILKPEAINNTSRLDDMQQSLESIRHKLDAEVIAKQKTIERQEAEIQHLNLLIESKDRIIVENSEKLKECYNHTEGNRQLINKLLGDISRLRQDIDWYKRTYEKRSFLGTIKEKFLKK